MKPGEIRALERLLDRMDYYRLLRVDPKAPMPEIRSAYHRSRREFHPDSYLNDAADLRDAVRRIASRITEAYVTIRNPAHRAAYDRGLAEGQVRFTQEVEEAAREEEEKKAGETPNGRRFYQLALEEERNGNLQRAVAQIKMALTFEARNEHFKSKLEAWQNQIKAEIKARKAAAR